VLSSSAAKKHSLASTISVTLRDDYCSPNHPFLDHIEQFVTSPLVKNTENIKHYCGVGDNSNFKVDAKVNSIDNMVNENKNETKPAKYEPIVPELPSKPDVDTAYSKSLDSKRPSISDVNGNQLIVVIDSTGVTCCKDKIGSLTCDRSLIERELIMHDGYLSGMEGDTELDCYMRELKKRQSIVFVDKQTQTYVN
jgi:hypothetical protein